ncbi:MAG: hypothetical protein IPN55_15220 [Saprospiraceae bacterium]|nr:hypothetical protein [Candidatus Brachybacter algidus]
MVLGTVFNWTNNTPSIGLPASGSGDIASFTATNATNDPVVATVTVTPSTLGSDLINFNYTGSMQTWTVPAGVTQVTLETWGAQGGPGNVGGNDPGGLVVTLRRFVCDPGTGIEYICRGNSNNNGRRLEWWW